MHMQPLSRNKSQYVALPVGQTVSRYRSDRSSGQGGFGITYRARDTRLNREVALKEYLPMALAVQQDEHGARARPVAEDFIRVRPLHPEPTLASLHQAPAIVRCSTSSGQ